MIMSPAHNISPPLQVVSKVSTDISKNILFEWFGKSGIFTRVTIFIIHMIFIPHRSFMSYTSLVKLFVTFGY